MSTKKQIPLIYLLLTAATLIAFWQVTQCGFISIDDDVYVTDNIHIHDGVTMEAIRWAFTTGYAANWHPLTWMSHMLDVQLFGLKPRWHHLTNLLFHVANTLLLFFIFHRMTKSPWRSAFVAALFAVHPLHVQSVAWVAERKDVLSTFFWMLTMGAYIHYVEHPRLKNYLAVLIFFALGLISKPMLVTLPFVLLLLDYWPLQRFEQKKPAQEIRKEAHQPLSANKRKGKSSRKHTVQTRMKEAKPPDHIYQRALIRPLLREKIPLFALAALLSIVTFIAQQKGGAVQSVKALPLGVRIANAFVSYIIYIAKTIWPANLAVYYPHPGLWPLWQILGAILLIAAVTFMVIRTAKSFPYLAVGWLWFAGTLVPVIGIVQVGGQALADRYTYVPLIGLFIMAAWGIPEFLKKWRYRKEALFASSALIIPCLLIVTCIQVGYWRNDIELYDHALKVTSRNDFIYRNRGAAYDRLGNVGKAIEDFNKAIEINPKYADAYFNRGVAYGQLGNREQAILDYNSAIEVNPKYADAYYNRGVAYGELGNREQAILDYNSVIEVNPKNAKAYNNLGIVYDMLGNREQAILDYSSAIEVNPRYAEAYNNRGFAYTELGNYRQAIHDHNMAIEINPKYAEAYSNLGIAYGMLENPGQAIEDFDKAIQINPRYATAYYNRGFAYGKLGNQRQTIEDMKAAARLDNEDAKNYLKSYGLNW